MFTWRRQVRDGLLVAPEMPVFVPVHAFATAATAAVLPQAEQPPVRSAVPTRAQPPSGLIEIELGDGRQVRVGSDVNLAALRAHCRRGFFGESEHRKSTVAKEALDRIAAIYVIEAKAAFAPAAQHANHCIGTRHRR